MNRAVAFGGARLDRRAVRAFDASRVVSSEFETTRNAYVEDFSHSRASTARGEREHGVQNGRPISRGSRARARARARRARGVSRYRWNQLCRFKFRCTRRFSDDTRRHHRSIKRRGDRDFDDDRRPFSFGRRGLVRVRRWTTRRGTSPSTTRQFSKFSIWRFTGDRQSLPTSTFHVDSGRVILIS